MALTTTKGWRTAHKYCRCSGDCQAGRPWHLPQEMTAYILDFLHDDKQALLCCSLVSRQWRFAAQHHLFSEVAVRSGESFLQFIESTLVSGTISVNIRRLTLDAKLPWQVQWGPQSRTLTVNLAMVLNSLPNLNALALVLPFPGTPSNDTNSPLQPQRVTLSLKQLNIDYKGPSLRNSVTQFLDTLSLFSEVETLRVEVARWDTVFNIVNNLDQLGMHIPCRPPSTLRIRKLIIEYSRRWSPLLIQYLHRCGSTATLTSLHILGSSYGDFPSFNELLHPIGSNLRYLRLNLISYGTSRLTGSRKLIQIKSAH
jgi:hypothetical protein